VNRYKFIEASRPLGDINKQVARVESIRRRHPSGFDRWCARQPLIVALAVLVDQVEDDPSSFDGDYRDQGRGQGFGGDDPQHCLGRRIAATRPRYVGDFEDVEW
jgi:hypothetical protein